MSAELWDTKVAGEFLVSRGISAPVTGFAELTGGDDNTNIAVECSAGKYVIRQYRVTGADDVEYELDLARHLATQGFPTPAPLPATSGELATTVDGLPTALFPFVEGVHPNAASHDDAVRAAELTARLHDLTEGYRGKTARKRTDHGRVARLRQCASSWISAKRMPDVERFVAEVTDIDEEMTAVENANRESGVLRWGAIHHDLNPGNLIYRDGEPVALIDFDEAYEFLLLQDLASLIVYWASNESEGRLNVAEALGLVEAYTGRRPLSGDELRHLALFLLFFRAADAADYVVRRASREDPESVVRDCWSYRHFREMRESREGLTAEFARLGR